MTKYFPSARSKSLGIFLWAILLLTFGFSFYQAIENSAFSQFIVVFSISIVTIIFIGTVWFKTGYFISNKNLIVKIGPFTYSEIRISKISEISRTHSIISAPANSFKRLAIKSVNKIVVISPKEEEDFIKAIKKLNPQIDVNL
ncbi:PH domain-containing protein [Eudoraea sp.]|uniref:PH domain-containing protein n=1 Tax=Eudoraea sp. TaxID=1979955 RepID=UPI003C761348